MTTGTFHKMIGVVIVCAFLAGCAETPQFIQGALGKGIAKRRGQEGEDRCPSITIFTVSSSTAQCGDKVSLELAAVSPYTTQLTYAWEIEGQTFETGQRAVWKTPTCETIGEPERIYTVRGVVSDNACSITRAVEVKVLCNCAFDAMVNFEFAKAALDQTAKIQLDELAKKLSQTPDSQILIEGHTDNIGNNQRNKTLGARRAESVKSYLMRTHHIEPNRIMLQSYGEEKPISSNETSTGRAKNRRAEIFRIVLKTRATNS